MKSSVRENIFKSLGCIIGVAFVLTLINFGMKWQDKRDAKYPWIGSLFKIENEVRVLRDSDRFVGLDECRAWFQKDIQGKSADGWDYECGTGCDYSDEVIIGGKRVKTYDCQQVEK